MAIISDIEVPALGISANYHRISRVLISYDPDPMVAGSAGTLWATVMGYPDKAARDAGRGGIDKGEYQIRFGVNVSGELNNARPASTYEDVLRDENGSIVRDESGAAVMVDKSMPAREATKVPCIASNEPTRAQIYAAVMALPQFAGAVID